MSMTSPFQQNMPVQNVPWWQGIRKIDDHQRAQIQKDITATLNRATPATSPQGSLGDLMTKDVALLPATMPITEQIVFPQSQAEVDDRFSGDFALMNFRTQTTALSPKTIAGSAPIQPMLVCGLCITARYTPYSWTAKGADVARTQAGNNPPRIPPVIPITGLPDDATAKPATIMYGSPVWRFLDFFLRNHNFMYLVSGILALVNERAVDIGLIDANARMMGFGTGQVDPMPDINRHNKRLQDMLSDRAFALPNVTGLSADDTALGPQLVDTQWGGPFDPGAYGCGCYPVTRHVIFPGMTYQFILSRIADAYYQNQLVSNVLANPNIQKPVDAWADTRAAGGGGAPPAIWSGEVIHLGGDIELGVTARGATMMPLDTLAWFMTYGQPYANLYTNPAVFTYLQQISQGCGLNGLVPKFVNPKGDPRLSGQGAQVLGALAGAIKERDKGELLKAFLGNDPANYFQSFQEFQAYASAT